MNKPPLTSRLHLPLLLAAAVFLVAVMPMLHAFGVIQDLTLSLWGKYICYGILAVSIDLLWGYTGLLCLGQALFFSIGGYMMGMHLMLMIGKLGQYKSELPDFFVFLGHTYLPSFWKPFYSFPFAVAMVILVPAVLAYIFGYLAFRSRIKGVYFSILTQALTYGAALLFFRNELLMGGNNGFTDFKTIVGADLRLPETKRGLYIASALLLVAVVAFCKWLTNSRFGLIQRAIRDSENRVLFSGYATANFKLFIFVTSAIIAGLAGALFVPQAGIINPS
ncbi:MAG: urea ABC transporter permease subunit UrtC, partial [Luteolibacter sp.]